MKKNTYERLAEWMGWCGVILILCAYGLIALNLIDARGSFYHSLNFIGGILIVVNAMDKKDRPVVLLNVVWSLFALVAIVRMFV